MSQKIIIAKELGAVEFIISMIENGISINFDNHTLGNIHRFAEENKFEFKTAVYEYRDELTSLLDKMNAGLTGLTEEEALKALGF